MKKMKRWLALVLAIALVSTNAIYQLGTHMSASESSQDTSVSEEQPQQEEQAADSQTQDTTEHTDSGQASVQEVTPDQSATATTQQAADVQQAADAQQTGAAQTDVAKTIAVKIQKSDVDGGTVKVVNADGSKSDVTYDGNNQYAKEVTEGESFGFEVTAKDGYQVEQVTDQNGTAIQPVSVNGNVSTYNVTDIRSEKVFSVTYNKVETQTEEKKDEKTENKAEDATATEETEDQNDADTQVTSTAGETHEDTDTEKWITVGKTVTLSNEYKSSAWTTYTHSWQIKKGNDVVSINASNSNSISVKGKKAGEATITDTITWNSFFEGQQKKTITYTIHVSEAVAPTAITINGADSVTQFKDINLTYTLTPTGAEGTVQWSSSNEDILTVDSSGKVTGLRRGQATVTANVYSGQSLLCSATKTIQVVEDTTVAGDSAIVYYLLDPTKDANSNDSGNWGPAYGTAKVNVTGATWTGGRNCFDNVDQRVVSWPNGTNVVTRDSTAWNQIFNKYKSSVEEQLGVPITEDDVVSITLRPAKISRNNSSTPDLHLDCNVDVNCKRVSIVHYYLLDKSSDPNSTEYVHQGSKSYINGNKTNPETVTGKSFPRTKTGTDGATYTFSGWYTDQELTQPATFPYTVNSNVNFYAKYVAGRQVVYNLDGGSFSDESSLTEKHNEGENVVVKSEPTRKGYKFTGWTVEGLDGVSSINSGASFQMPNNNVTITANWEEQKIEDFVELTPKDVEKVYDGEAHAAGVATATDKNGYQLKIEYSVDGENWTENPADITATNVSDSKTIKVRVSNEEKYTGYIEKTEKLAITRRPVTVTANSCQKTFGTADPEFTAKVEGTLGNDKVDYKLSREKGEDVGTYTITSTGDEKQGNYKVTYNPGTLTIVAAQRTTELSVTSYNGVYDAKKHTIAVNGTVDGDKVEYSYDGGKTWVADLKEYKNVTDGSVAIQVKVTNTNYTPSETILNGTVTITPFPLVVKADDKSKVFGEKDPKLTATETSGVEGKEKPDNQKIERTMTREAGENVGNYKITASGETTQGNYTVTYKPGTLTITAGSRPADRQLSVTSYNGVYDAQKHTITVNNVLDGDVVEYSYDGGKTWTTDLTKYTDVTNTTIKVRVTNANYDPNPVELEGTVTITPKPVTVTARSYSKTFGTADPTFEADTAGTLNGDKITYDISRETGENVGTYTITPAGEAVQGNYNVTYATGTLKITKAERKKDIEVVNYKDVYDAGNHTIEVKNLVVGDKVEYSYDDGKTWTTDLKQYKDVTAEVKIQVKVTNDNYKPVDIKTGTVEITRRPVTVTANSYQKTFGETDPKFTAKVEGTLGTDKVDYTLSRKTGEDVGTYTITPTGDEKQGNYKVTYKQGTLTIVAAQRTTELSVTSYNGVYDAKKHTIAVNGTVDGDKVEYSYDGGKTWVADLKEYKNVTDGSVAIQVKVTNTNYTPSETILNGTVTITPFPLVVKADDKSKVFGEKDPKLTATETSGVEGKEKPDNQKIERTMTREAGENVGNYKITASGETTQGNYTVTYKPGTLTITAGSRPADRQLSVTSYNGVYDAQKHTITVNNVLDGDVVEYSYDGGKTWTTDLTKYTDVTNTTIKVRVTNANYDPNPVELEGTVTITPKPVTVTARSYSKTFGTADPTFEADTAGTLNGDKITYDISRETGEDVGNYALTPSGEEVQGNYTVTYNSGKLTITASDREKAVEVTSYNGVYDAKNHTIEVKNLVDGDQVEYSYDNGTTWTTDLTQYKDVTETTILVKVTNANYADVPQLTGTVTITRFPLVVKAEDKSKVFGEKDPKLTAAETSGLEGKAKPDKQEITYDLSREAGENVGEYPITVKGEVVQGNYTVTYEPGKLTITKAERAKDIEVVNYKNVYDAGNHTIEVKNLVDGDKVEYSYDGGKTWTTDLKQYKDVTAEVKIQVKVTNDNYKPVDTKTGTVEITRRPVTVTANSYQKTFGETDPEFTAKVKGTLGNDKVDYKLSREKGENVGTYTITPTGDEKQGNYTVTYKPGSLTIVAAQRTTELSVTSYNGVYDAKKHTITVNGTVAGDKVEYSYNGITWSDKLKEYTDVIDTEIKVRVTNSNYEPAVTDNLYGRVTITSRPISITGEGWDTDQLYTGKAYKTDKFEWENANKANTRGLVDGQSVNTTYKLEGTNVSEKPYTGVFTAVQIMSADNKDVTNNYTVKTNPGTLKIVAQSINPGPNPENPDPSYDGIQIDSPSDVEYDGQAHKWSPTVTDKNGNALTEDTDYEVSYDKDDFTDVKTITVTITGKGNYTGTVTRVYNILAAPLIIRTEKAEKTYDGKPLTNENMTIEGLKNGEVVAHKTTGTQTEVGNSDNTYELDWNSKESTAKESNYIIKEVSLGKLVVKETEDEIVVTTTGGTFTYDGQPHGATVEVSELPEGYTLQTAESDATATDVTTEAVTADADRLVIVNAAGVDVTANLKITRVTGEIVVNPATVTVTTPNASKVYDGTPLTAAGTITGLVNGETVSFATTGTITNVGTATNSYSLVWDQTAKETNYTVSENLGTLTVTAPTNNNPSVTPTPPATPNPPATPSDNPGVLDRVVDTIKDVAADVQEVFSSDDGDVPLANQNLDEHKCCILHFLIMLLTAILYGFFTHNMKKRQKKNFELREELDTELVKRGLPTSKEQKNS